VNPGVPRSLTGTPPDLRLARQHPRLGAFKLVVPSPSPLDCLGRVRRVKAKPHAVASRALTRRPRPEGRQLSRRTGEEQGTAISAGRTPVRRAISGPLTPVTSGLSRSLADAPPRRSCHVTGPDGTDSQADSAGSIPVTRSIGKGCRSEPSVRGQAESAGSVRRDQVPAWCPSDPTISCLSGQCRPALASEQTAVWVRLNLAPREEQHLTGLDLDHAAEQRGQGGCDRGGETAVLRESLG
jgi:hypothetical protein